MDKFTEEQIRAVKAYGSWEDFSFLSERLDKCEDSISGAFDYMCILGEMDSIVREACDAFGIEDEE